MFNHNSAFFSSSSPSVTWSLYLHSLFHKRTPNSGLMSWTKVTNLKNQRSTLRRTVKAKRRGTRALKAKENAKARAKARARARAKARAGRDPERKNIKKKVSRMASSGCPQRCLSIYPTNLFSPQICQKLRAPQKRSSPLECSTRPSWRWPHMNLTQLRPSLWCPALCLHQRLLRR